MDDSTVGLCVSNPLCYPRGGGADQSEGGEGGPDTCVCSPLGYDPECGLPWLVSDVLGWAEYSRYALFLSSLVNFTQIVPKSTRCTVVIKP